MSVLSDQGTQISEVSGQGGVGGGGGFLKVRMAQGNKLLVCL